MGTVKSLTFDSIGEASLGYDRLLLNEADRLAPKWIPAFYLILIDDILILFLVVVDEGLTIGANRCLEVLLSKVIIDRLITNHDFSMDLGFVLLLEVGIGIKILVYTLIVVHVGVVISLYYGVGAEVRRAEVP